MIQKSLQIVFGNNSVSIPYYVFEGSSPGTSLFISGGMHGDEVNGMHYVHQFLQWAKADQLEQKLRGKIYVFPVLNVHGFQEKIRYVPQDGRDLNRSFGLDPSSSMSAAIAATLVDTILKYCDIGIDIHDSGSDNILVPHTRIHISDELKCRSCSRELAKMFGLHANLERAGDPHMLAVHMNAVYNKSVLTVEIGGGLQVHAEHDGLVLEGLRRMLCFANMIDGTISEVQNQYFAPERIYYRLPRASIFTLPVQLGDVVQKGETIGSMYMPDKQEEVPIVAPATGIVFSRSENNQGRAGEVVVSVLADER